jgi:polyferredoxin
MHPENFVEKILAALGFLSGVIAFLSGLVMTMTWLHFLVPLGVNVNGSSFLLMLSFMILAATSIMAPVVVKMDDCRHIPLILGRPFLNTTKSTGMKEFSILTGISSTVPTGSQID